MCGFARRVQLAKIPRSKINELLNGWGIGDLPDGNFFPGTLMTGVVIGEGAGARAIDATWWFMLEERDGVMKPNRKLTTFNARNLDNRMWKAPLKTSRCIIPVTGIVETKGGKSYRMDAEDGLLLGGLYRTWAQGDALVYSCTVITCEPHPRFSEYHDKSIPLFLPPDEPALLNAWLDPSYTDAEYFKGLTAAPRITSNFQVRPVKNSQNLEALGDTEILERDE